MDNKFSSKARRIIEKNIFMILATASKDGSPWATPVYYAYDQNYKFYWYSRKATKHSELIAENPKVSIVIFNSSASTKDTGGVYIDGKASEVLEEELKHTLEVYFTRAKQDPKERKKLIKEKKDFMGDSQLRMYRFIPDKVYVSGEATKWNGKWLDIKIEVQL